MEDLGKKYQNKIGVILTNLGTPKSPVRKDVKKYLNQFLLDRRVVDINRLLWVPLLKLIILTIRPSKSAKLYKKIWMNEGSPLLVYMNKIKDKAERSFKIENFKTFFEIGMRYGEPSLSEALKRMKENNVSKIIILPLYPQSGSPTTSTTYDEISNILKNWTWVPDLVFVSGYHDNKDYINALAKTIKQSFKNNGMPDKILFSYHGMPKRYLENGDPYYCFCHKTTRLVAEKLKLNKEKFDMSFQSRFGTEEWLKPYTDDMLMDYGKNKIKNIHVISPGFSVDCLETLEEIEIQYKELFLENGGEKFHYIPCLNDSDEHVQLINKIIDKKSKVWF